MKFINSAVFSAIVLGVLSCSVPARAQFGTLFVPSDVAAGAQPHNTVFSVYPLAAFVASGGGSTATKWGGLIALDNTFHPSASQGHFEIGAWYFIGNHADIYCFHGKAYFNDKWGVQIGVLGSSYASGNPFQAFLLYKIASTQRKQPSSLEIGLGTFVDTTAGDTTSGFSAYLQGTVRMTDRWDFDASYWYVRDRGVDFNRLALGFGFHF